MSTDIEEWAQSLVGRDWEIFWENNDGDDEQKMDDTTTTTSVDQNNNNTPSTSQTTKDSANDDDDDEQGSSDGDDDDDEQEDISDWYDGRILSWKRDDASEGDNNNNNPTFDIKYVGEEQVYTMTLSRSLVRPSARAWLVRTKGLLSSSQADDRWLDSLPVDTASLEDQGHLAQLRRSRLLLDDEVVVGKDTTESPNSKQLADFQELRYQIQAQCYLRTKLAPIVDIGEKAEDEPSEAYVNYLVKCLQRLSSCCDWYAKCWKLREQVLSTDDTDTALLIDLVQLQKGCLEAGRDEIVNIFLMDVTPSGIHQKRPPPSSGTRRTKRRRVQRDPGHMPSSGGSKANNPNNSTDEDDMFDDLGDLFSVKAVERFVKKAKSEAQRWFEVHTLDMLRYISQEIHEPVIRWTRKAEYILGERKESDDESSAGKTSVEEKEEDGNESDISMDEPEEKVYSYQDAKETLDEIPQDRVLKSFDLSRWTTRLTDKLRRIEEFERDAWHLTSKITDEAEMKPGVPDSILIRLATLRGRANGADPLLAHVDPLGVSPSSKMTKEVVEDADLVRQWVVDLAQTERHRERVAFIQDVVARASTLPHLPPSPYEAPGDTSLSTKLAQAVARVQNVSSKLFSDVHLVRQYERNLAESNDPATDTEGLRTPDGIKKALYALSLLPALSLVEEKLAVRKDLLAWIERVKPYLNERTFIKFVEIESLYKSLTSILSGISPGRLHLTERLSRIEKIEKEVRQFARNDANNLSEGIVARLEALYVQAAGWKERADSIVFALRVHGNERAGDAISSTKPSAMVDCKRMADLLQEYGAFNVSVEEEHAILQAVYNETIAWSQRINDSIENDQELLPCLLKYCDERPKGVMVDPARHVLDVIMEMLEWHNKVKIFMKQVASSNTPSNHPEVFGLVAEGVECLERFAKDNQSDCKFQFTAAECLEEMAALFEFQRTTKGIAPSKIESTAVGRKVFQRLMSPSFDAKDGYPMFWLLGVVWAIHVTAFVDKATSAESGKSRPNLEQAIALNAKQPRDARSDNNLEWNGLLSFAINTLNSLIQDGQRIETEAKQIIIPDKERFRGSIGKANEVRAHLACLKQLQASIKSPKQGGKGLLLDVQVEKPVDQLTKDLSWLERTLAYPILHSHLAEVAPENRIPWDVLVRFHERLPTSGDAIVGDMPMLVLRVKELHEAANMWQESVTSLLSLSIRGSKRRQPGVTEGDTDTQDSQTKVFNAQLEDLVKDPILESVVIPREDAVRGVVEKAREFEKLMYRLLGKDFSGAVVDKSPYPEASSLIGTKGEFLLYRLTGSQLFSALKSSVESISLLSADIAADTPGKQAFDWIIKCVKWIDLLDHSVTSESPFGDKDRLVVPADKADSILEMGNQLFLEISDDIRRTLSSHRILLSTNKQSAKLTVTIGKGGAHHSTGGTAIKWCPLIFDWLRNDAESFRDWEKRATEIMKRCTEANAAMESQVIITQADVNKIYRIFEDIKMHLNEGRDFHVVAPPYQLIDKLRSIQTLLDKWVQNRIAASKGSLSLKAAKVKRYEVASAISDSDEILDSLLVRRRIHLTSKRTHSAEKLSPTEIREKVRAKLEKVMRKGMRMMGLKTTGASDVGLHCVMRAWEIESVAFSSQPIMSEYTQKIRSIVNNLDSLKNPKLCAMVLSGSLSAEDLLEMSPEAMANQAVRNKREEAEHAGKKSVIVAGAMAKVSPKQKGKSVKGLLASVTNAQGLKPSSSDIANSKPSASIPIKLPSLTSPSASETGSGRFSPVSNVDALAVAAAVQAAQRAASAAPPPPPPSLLAQPTQPMVPVAAAASTNHGGVVPVESRSGSDTFSFSINGNNFQAKLEIENGSYPNIDKFLPEALSNNPGGRSRVDVFSDFLDGKLKSDNWTVTLMRLSVCGGSSSYKRFYKEFEMNKRIAMCKLEDGKESKLFLVTPKFHSAVGTIRRHLTKRSSSYAVLITRQIFFHD